MILTPILAPILAPIPQQSGCGYGDYVIVDRRSIIVVRLSVELADCPY